MDDASHKKTSVFLEGDFSRKDRKAGGPTSVSATIDRSEWKRVRLGEDAVLQTTAPMHSQNRVICNVSLPMRALHQNRFFGCRIYNEPTVNGAI